MSKKFGTSLKLILSAMALLLLFGCSMVETDLAVAAASRDIEVEEAGNGPVGFTATINLIQTTSPLDTTIERGQGKHNRTIGEQLATLDPGTFEPSPVVSSWDLLDGAMVTMDNRTEFNLDPIYPGYELPANIKGINHSEIEVTTTSGEILYLKAQGRVEGVFPAQATVTMNWTIVGTESGDKISGSGTLTGIFDWKYLEDIATCTVSMEGFYND